MVSFGGWARLNKTKLAGANLDHAVLDQAWLLEADLTGATLRGANIFAAQMALSGLISRDRSQQAVHLETSMLDIIAYYNFPDMFHNQTFVEDTAAATLAPQPVLATRDGYMVLSPVSTRVTRHGSAVSRKTCKRFSAMWNVTSDMCKK